MKIEKRKIVGDIVQITTSDERWYELNNKFMPSVTWIANSYPKGTAYYKWLASKGWDEAETIKKEAGEKGSRVHNAAEDLLKGETVKMDAKYPDNNGEMAELTVEEYGAIMSFADWFNELKDVKIVEIENTVFNEIEGYAGTLDMVLIIDGEKWIVDIKTSAYIWPSHEIQISAYKHCGYEDARLAILQVGYKRNKKGFKFTELVDKFDLFLHAKAIWKNENENVHPRQKDYPTELKLNDRKT